MYLYQQNQEYPTYYKTGLPVGSIVAIGAAGAMLTGVAAAARDVREAKAGEMTRSEAVSDVAKEAVGGGLAAAAGAAVAGLFFRPGFLSLTAMAVVGIGAKYAYDGIVSSGARAKNSPVKTVKKA